MARRGNLLIVWTALLVGCALGVTSVQAASPRWEPQIAVLCEAGQVFQPQYLSEEGRWVTDLNKKTSGATCLRDKMDLLDYCKKAYPNRDITNIVESSHYQKIGGWCRQGAMNSAKCKGVHRWIKPFRCLEGPFQSDALLVPEGCIFDHIHNASRCWPFVRWNQTGAAACQERGMQMRSFAMLLPCGISLFSGVEFVCCPKHFKTDEIRVKKTDLPVVMPSEMQASQNGGGSADDLLVADDVDDDDIDVDDSSSYSKGDDDVASSGAVSSAASSGGGANSNGNNANANNGEDDDDEEDDLLSDDEEDEMIADEAAAAGGAGSDMGSGGSSSAASEDAANGEYPDSAEESGDNYEEDGQGAGIEDGASSAAAWDTQNGGGSGGSSMGGKLPAAGGDSVDSKKSDSKASGSGAAAVGDSVVTGLAGSPPQQQPAATNQPTADPYFTHFDPHYEHQSYKEAQQRLEESHREKVTRVMKDWSDLEEKYQDMRLADPKAAQSFKQRMTARFQALEEEGNAEKHQLAAMHQQRVLAHINQRKREAMTCYTQALTEQPPNAHHVEKCLQKLLRALHKDRAHALAHYRHLLNSGGPGGLEAAASERPRTLERLIDIDRAVNQSMTMLKRYPELTAKISQLMNDYILALRSKDDIPGSSLGMSEEAEAAILDKYRVEIERKVAEKERLRLAEKQRKEQRAAEREKLREEKLRMEAKKVDELMKSQQAVEQQQKQSQQQEDVAAVAATSDGGDAKQSNIGMSAEDVPSGGASSKHDEKDLNGEEYADSTISSTKTQTVLPTVDDDAVQRAVEDVAAAVAHQVAEPQVQHFQAHALGHRESSFSLRSDSFAHAYAKQKEGRNVYFTLSFAGIALMAAIFVGVAVAKWRTSRSPHAQGFIEVDQNATTHHPVVAEEKIVPNMQINGYENPTYKYFEVKE